MREGKMTRSLALLAFTRLADPVLRRTAVKVSKSVIVNVTFPSRWCREKSKQFRANARQSVFEEARKTGPRSG